MKVIHPLQAIRMTLSDHEGHSPTASLAACDFLYSCASVAKISTDILHRAVPVQ